MCRRKSIQRLQDWSLSKTRTIAVVTGPRCVGKTTLVRDLGRIYGRFIEIDMKECMWLRGVIARCSGTDDLCRKLTAAFGEDSVVPGDTLLLLDEIEYCHDAAWHLEALADRECIDIVAVASCITAGTTGFRLDPWPWEHRIELPPLDFGEFLEAMGVGRRYTGFLMEKVIEGMEISFDEDASMDLMFRRYMITGGMPAAVAAMAGTRRILETTDASRAVLKDQVSDARVFARRISDTVSMCVRSIPVQLETNGRFRYSKMENGKYVNRRSCYESVEWLVDSGIVTLCDRIPLPVGSCEEQGPMFYKLYIDPGALASMLDGWMCDAVMNGHYRSCPCAVVENSIAASLRAGGFGAHYYSNGRKEADFIVPLENETIGIIVRSYNNPRRKSTASLMDEGLITRSLEFSSCKKTGSSETYPLYAAGFPEMLLKEGRRAERDYPLRSARQRCFTAR